MRIIIKTVFTIILTGSLLSCTDLIKEEYQNILEDNFYQSEADVKAAVTGMYGTGMMRFFFGDAQNVLTLSEMQADGLKYRWTPGWGDEVQNFRYSASVGWETQKFYQKFVQGISKATTMIAKIEEVDIDEDVKAQYIAEVRVLRAHIALWAYHVYGGVSMMLDPEVLANVSGEELFEPRYDKAQTAEFIISEIDAVADNLPDMYPQGHAEYGRMTKGAALMIKLKILMQEKRWTEAEATGREITTLGYSLQSTVKDVFTLANEENAETILSYPCETNVYPSNPHWAMSCPYDYVMPNSSADHWGVYVTPWDVIDTYDDLDERKAMIVTEYEDTNGNMVVRGEGELGPGGFLLKYDFDGGLISHQGGNDVIVFRYADALLLLAEAINENSGPTQEAIDIVNQIRQRAFPSNPEMLYQSGDPELAGKDAFREAIYNERGWELLQEGSRRFDMIRHGKFNDYAKSYNDNYLEHQMLWPIPQWIIDQSAGIVKQNPIY